MSSAPDSEAARAERSDLPHQVRPGHPLYDDAELTGTTDYGAPVVEEPDTAHLFHGTRSFYHQLANGAFHVRDDDVWLITYPKAGTTWTYEIILQLLAQGDAEKVAELRTHYGDHSMVRVEIGTYDAESCIEKMNTSEPPRMYGSHLPDQYIPERVKKSNKVIVVMRNPKDCCVSYYHFHRMNRVLGRYSGTFSAFYQAWIQNKAICGSWFDYTIDMWENHKDDKNYLFLKFEDMKKDPEVAIKKIAQHLEQPLSDSLLAHILQVTTFNSMKVSMKEKFERAASLDQTISPFLRKGAVGDWKNHFTVAQSEHFDQLYEERFKCTDLTFDFELK